MVTERWKLAVRSGVGLALQRPIVHRGARAVEQAFDSLLLARLRSAFPEVTIHLRGSAARAGGRMPFLSDLDLAIVVPRDTPAGARARFARLNAFFARWRLRHPGFRDAWQTVVDESELPALRRYGRLLDCHEWLPALATDDVPARWIAEASRCALAKWQADARALVAQSRFPLHRYLSMQKKMATLRAKADFFSSQEIATREVCAVWSARCAQVSRDFRWRLGDDDGGAVEVSGEGARLFRALTAGIVPRLRAGHPLERQNLLRVVAEMAGEVSGSPSTEELFAIYYGRARELTERIARGE